MSKPAAIILLIAGIAAIWFRPPGDYWLLWAGQSAGIISVAALLGRIVPPREEMVAIRIGELEYLLLPRQTRQERFRRTMIPLFIAAACGAEVSGTLVGHHYSLTAWQQVFVAMTLVLVCLALGYFFLRRRRGLEIKAIINTYEPFLDQPFRLRIGTEGWEAVEASISAVSLRCSEHVLLHMGRYTQLVIRDHSEEQIHFAAGENSLSASAMLAGAPVLLESTKHRPSGKSGYTMYPFYRWRVEVEVAGKARPDCEFPITINTTAPLLPE